MEVLIFKTMNDPIKVATKQSGSLGKFKVLSLILTKCQMK